MVLRLEGSYLEHLGDLGLGSHRCIPFRVSARRARLPSTPGFLASGGMINGGAGLDTLKLAAGTQLNLANLTSNAVRYTPEGGIVVGVRRRGANWRIDVIDSGSPRSKADAVFIKYQLPVAKSGLLSSTANIAHQYASGSISFRGKVATDDLLQFIDSNPDIVDAVNYVYDSTPHENPVAKSIAAAFYFFACRKDRQLADAYILRFMVGAVEGANDNLLYLRNFCFNARAARRPVQVGDIFGRLVIVWNSERRGKPIKHPHNIRVSSESAYPRFI